MKLLDRKSIKVVGFLLCFFGSICVFNNTYAAECSGVAESTNDAIYDACKFANSKHDTRYGALWISNSSSSTSVSSTVTVDDWETGDGKVTIYLHGAVFKYGGASDAKATYIKLVRGTSEIKGTASGYSSYSPFEEEPSSINRKGNGLSSTIKSNVASFKLNVKKMVDIEGANYTTSGSYHVYTIPIQAFRCFEGTSPYSGNTGCYSSRSTLKVKVKVASKFEGRASVAQGTDWGSTTNRVTTGWKETDGSVSISEECANGGCKANYWLELKRTSGGGKDGYRKKAPGGEWSSWKEVNPGSGKIIVGTNSNVGKALTLRPGQSKCYDLAFYPTYPYGSAGENSWKTVTACASAKVTNFQGKTSVTGAASKTAGYSGSTKTELVTISNCSPISGCKVSFSHYLKRTSTTALGSTKYTITRTSNLTSKVSSTTLANNQNFNSNESTVKTDNNLVLYPGMVVCERLTFKPSNDVTKTVENVYTQVCVSALGNAQPPDPSDPDAPENPNDPSGDSSFINIKVRNKSVSKYNNFQRLVYAKPGDTVVYRATYNPVLQYTYALKPQKMRIDGGTIYPTNGVNSSATLASMFNTYKDPGWNNAFAVYSSNFDVAYSQPYNFANGNTTKRSKLNNYKVKYTEVGRSLDETAKTNVIDGTSTTPGQVIFTNNSGSNLGNVITDPIWKTAHTLVPYNFVNSTDITKDEDDPLYAGESMTIDISIDTKPKQNDETDGNYATKVDEAKTKMEICFNGTCVDTPYINVNDGILNGSGNMDGDSINSAIFINIPDLPAGSQVCLRSAVYPKDSGPATNINKNYYDVNSPNSWAYSTQKCFIVAKRPSTQVWGGGVYSNGNIALTPSIKNNLAGIAEYPYSSTGGNKIVFGSWTELSLAANGTVTGLASGAGTGYGNTNDATNPAASPSSLGGSAEGISPSYCIRSTLSFANNNCNSSVGNLSSIQSNTSSDKSSLVSRFTNTDSDEYTLEEYNDNTTIGELIISPGETKVIKAQNNTITISNNIKYSSDSTYSTLESIPKLIIYANNIDIDCNVTRIDAVLIANENIDTCANIEDINAEGRSNQLIINGATISDTLTLGRTYGAATGINSIIPAEIINYDSSLFLWSNQQASSNNTGKLTEASTRELSPRY